MCVGLLSEDQRLQPLEEVQTVTQAGALVPANLPDCELAGVPTQRSQSTKSVSAYVKIKWEISVYRPFISTVSYLSCLHHLDHLSYIKESYLFYICQSYLSPTYPSTLALFFFWRFLADSGPYFNMNVFPTAVRLQHKPVSIVTEFYAHFHDCVGNFVISICPGSEMRLSR